MHMRFALNMMSLTLSEVLGLLGSRWCTITSRLVAMLRKFELVGPAP